MDLTLDKSLIKIKYNEIHSKFFSPLSTLREYLGGKVFNSLTAGSVYNINKLVGIAGIFVKRLALFIVFVRFRDEPCSE